MDSYATAFLTALALWRLMILIQYDRGPFDIIGGLRRDLSGIEEFKLLIECKWCLSFWLALIACYRPDVVEWITHTLAMSAILVIIDSLYWRYA
jgi:hypothetical protein